MTLTGLSLDTFSLYRVSFFTDHLAFQTPSKALLVDLDENYQVTQVLEYQGA